MTRLDAVICMPAFNEEASIGGFVREIAAAFSGQAIRFVVVDDRSTDGTGAALEALVIEGLPLDVISNSRNLGHGPTTLVALAEAVALSPNFVIATDGDGHVLGDDLFSLYRTALECRHLAVVEGVRTRRENPAFRKVASAATRLLVRLKSGVGPADANTPVRIYPLSLLSKFLVEVPPGHLTPNLVISVLTRTTAPGFIETPILVVKRPGTENYGSTWNQRIRSFPSMHFVSFCLKAGLEWLGPHRFGEKTG